ncbi:major facilitator superfamily domain-containing protein [Mycena vulgaris]|nr:major facilitator superfamily domain-containing protein [Mycena vulgaris]
MASAQSPSRPRTRHPTDTVSGQDFDHGNPGAAEEGEAHESPQQLPWWRRPGPWWLMVLWPFSAFILAATMAAKHELYTTLVCRVHRPELVNESLTNINTLLHLDLLNSHPSFSNVNNAFQSNPCSSDFPIQLAVAKLTGVISALTGFLTFITGGWWGSFSDRHGRKRLLGIAAIGQLISSLNIIFVAKYVQQIPGGYWLLVVDATIVGVLGGTSSEAAAVYAYIADVATPDNRSRIFSAVTGSMLVGIGFGPMLSNIFLRSVHNILWVFYLAAAFRIIHTCFVWFILPESLTPAEMHTVSVRHEENNNLTEPTVLLWLQRLFFFLKPLSVLLPAKTFSPRSSSGGRRDWNLPILILVSGLITSGLASSSRAIQLFYAISTFQWDSHYFSYYLHAMSATRALYLLLILPLAITFVKNRHSEIVPPPSESEPLLSRDSDRLDQDPTRASVFDLDLAHLSILVDMVTFVALPIAPNGTVFTLFSVLGSFGIGFGSAFRSVALEVYSRRFRKTEPVESGKLFGALSVASSVFSEILSPIYSLIYAATITKFPQAIFFVALGSSILAFALLGCVKLRP